MALDAVTFDALYAANADRLFSMAYRLLGDRDAAADIVQDAFVKAFTASDDIREPAAWLTTVARNGALNSLRRTGRLVPLAEEADDEDVPTAAPLIADEPAADPLHAAATSDAVAIVDELLDSLTPAQRTALVLFHAQEQPISAIASALGRTVNATTVLLHRSRAALRARFAERVYARTTIADDCRAFRPELLAHLEAQPVPQAYLDHLATDAVCQSIEAELRGMGRVLAILPLVPAPAGLQASVEAAVAATATAGTVGASGGAATTTSAGTQGAGGVSGVLGTTAGKIAVGAVALVIAAGAAVLMLASPPPAVTPVSFVASDVVAIGEGHSCAIRSDRSVACWGGNRWDQANAPDGTFAAVSAGLFGSCAIRADETIACWGLAGPSVEPPAGTFSSVSSYESYSCGIRTDGSLACWGIDWMGETIPPPGTYTALSTGKHHACAVASDGALACWGDREQWPDPPAGIYTAVTVGYAHACAISADASLTCWGDNEFGQLDVPAGSYVGVGAGSHNTCALRTDGTVECWGAPDVLDPPAGTFTALVVGWQTACALTEEGTLTCWGNNSFGQADAPDGPFGLTTD